MAATGCWIGRIVVNRLMVAEPSANYLTRPSAVVDASLLVALVYGETTAEQAEMALRPYTLHAPTLLTLEVVNAGINKLRRKLASETELAQRLEAFDFGCLRFEEIPHDAVFSLAARYRLTAYDAAYLWLAGALMAPLFTFDARLAEAARDFLAGPGK